MMLPVYLLVISIGMMLLSVECRSFATRTPAAIIPGLGFLNKKEDEEQKQDAKRQSRQELPPLPPRPTREQSQQQSPVEGAGGRRPFVSNSGQVTQRRQQYPQTMGPPPLPPPPRQTKAVGEFEHRRPLPPPIAQQHRDDPERVEEEEADATEVTAIPDAPEFDQHGSAAFPYEKQEELPEQHIDQRIQQETMVDGMDLEEQTYTLQQQQEPPPPPMWQESGSPFGPFGGMPWGGPPMDGAWGAPPYDDSTEEQWRMQQQQQRPYYPPPQAMDGQQQYSGRDDIVQQLRTKLDDSHEREQGLLEEIHNLTSALGALRTEDESHLEQVDMLTERVVEAEARAASERNAALEYRANCTDMARTLAIAQDEVEEWKEQCENFKDANHHNEKKLHKTTKDLKSRSAELEELALVIENLRLRDEHDRYVAERKKKKSGGLLSWLFGGFMREEAYGEDQLDSAQELARSTLLRALQTERNNVEELENAVSVLQQNNSAISEVVKSRDSLINELNDRVAVFEEDKVVLKAALRQLQKEIKEEAPKTQKLLDHLKKSKEDNKNLKAEIESLVESHQNEIFQLQRAISQKQSAINDKESNLTVIGTYVDKLEERLGDFALARREIEIREEKCKKIEERALQTKNEKDLLQAKVDEFVKEEEEFKSLLEDLAIERTQLRSEKTVLQQERDKLLLGEKVLQESITTLEDDVQQLSDVLEEWKVKVEDLEAEIEELQSVNEDELSAAEEDTVPDLGGGSGIEQGVSVTEVDGNATENELFAVVEVEKSIVEGNITTKEISSSQIHNLDGNSVGAPNSTSGGVEHFVKEPDHHAPGACQTEINDQPNNPPPPPLRSMYDSEKVVEEQVKVPVAIEMEKHASLTFQPEGPGRPSDVSQLWDDSIEEDAIAVQKGGNVSNGVNQRKPGLADSSEDEVAQSVSKEIPAPDLDRGIDHHNGPGIQETKQDFDTRPLMEAKPPLLPHAPPGVVRPPLGQPMIPNNGTGRKGPSIPPGKKGAVMLPTQPRRRKVPFRRIRKVFSKVTGVHGFFTRPSHLPPTPKQPQ